MMRRKALKCCGKQLETRKVVRVKNQAGERGGVRIRGKTEKHDNIDEESVMAECGTRAGVRQSRKLSTKRN
jgi:hypothetical protein